MSADIVKGATTNNFADCNRKKGLLLFLTASVNIFATKSTEIVWLLFDKTIKKILVKNLIVKSE